MRLLMRIACVIKRLPGREIGCCLLHSLSKNVDRLEQGNLSILREQNFNPCLDVLCSTDAPPIVVDSLNHCLPPNAASRMCGRSFTSLLFVEVFCGTGGLSAVLKRSGIGQVLGITSRMTGNTQCSVLPLDLYNDSQHPLVWDVLERHTHTLPGIRRRLPRVPTQLRFAMHMLVPCSRAFPC